jgi:GSH-dependent disulfide-bond oxidoreductase
LLATGGQWRAEALSWLFWATSGLGPTVGRLLKHVSTLTGQSGEDPFEHETIRLMRVLEKRLNEGPFLASAYSIADIAVFAWLKFAFPVIKTRLGEQLGITPGIDGWLKEINAREAVQRGLRASKIVRRRNAAHST